MRPRKLTWFTAATLLVLWRPAGAGGFCAGDRARFALSLEQVFRMLEQGRAALEMLARESLRTLEVRSFRLLLWGEYLQGRQSLLDLLVSDAPVEPPALEAVVAPWRRAIDLHRATGESASVERVQEARSAAHRALVARSTCRALFEVGPRACASLARLDPTSMHSCAFLARQFHVLGRLCRTTAYRSLLRLHGGLARGCLAAGDAFGPVCRSLFYGLTDWQFSLCAALAEDDESACSAPGFPPERAEPCLRGLFLDRFLRGQISGDELPARFQDALLVAPRPGEDCALMALRSFDRFNAAFFSLALRPAGPPLPGLW